MENNNKGLVWKFLGYTKRKLPFGDKTEEVSKGAEAAEGKATGKEGERMTDAVSLQVINIQKTGSDELKNQFIQEWLPKALEIARIKCSKKWFKRFITTSSEEFSVVMAALQEAIKKYDPNQNAKFETFYSKVIDDRLKDYYRDVVKKEKRYIALSQEQLEKIDAQAYLHFQVEEAQKDAISEQFDGIVEYLGRYGYTWEDVQENRPDHGDSERHLKAIALAIVQKGLAERFLAGKPDKEFEKLLDMGVHRRQLKKYYPFLVALIVAHLYFPGVKDYLIPFEEA